GMGAFIRGSLDITDFLWEDNDIEAFYYPIYIGLSGGATFAGIVKGGKIRQITPDPPAQGGSAIQLAGCASLALADVDIEGYYHGIYAAPGASNGTVRIVGNRIKSRGGKELIRNDGAGVFQVIDNKGLDLPPGVAFVAGAGAWNAKGNLRGFSATIPDYTGS